MSKPNNAALLVQAAGDLVQPFTVEQLVVMAWKMHPDRFGLSGWNETHPDSNKVIACLSHKKGPVKTGLLERCGSGKLRLTAAGRELVESMRAPIDPKKEKADELLPDYRPPAPGTNSETGNHYLGLKPKSGNPVTNCCRKAADLISDVLLGPTHEERAAYRISHREGIRRYTRRLSGIGRWLSEEEAEKVLEACP